MNIILILLILLIPLSILFTYKYVIRNHQLYTVVTSFKKNFEKTGLPLVEVTLKNKKTYLFILDTGASINVIDTQIANEVFPNLKRTPNRNITCLNGVKVNIENITIPFDIDDSHFKSEFSVSDYATVFEEVARYSTGKVVGILGSSFFMENNLGILYSSKILTK